MPRAKRPERCSALMVCTQTATPSPGVPRLMAGERHTYLADDASPLRQAGYGGVGHGLRIDGRRRGLLAALRRGRRRLGFDAVALFDFEVGQAFGVRAGSGR